MNSIRETSGDSNGHSFVETPINVKRQLPHLQCHTNKVKRNTSYSSSILPTPILANNNSYSFANISDNKNNNKSINSNNLNDYMMSRERTVKRDYSYKSSFRRKKTFTPDYLQNKTLETGNSNNNNSSNVNRYSFYGRNDVARRPTLDPFYNSSNKNSPNPNSITSSNDGSIRNSNYVHSGTSYPNSPAVKQRNQLGSSEELNLNKLTSKLSLSSLATGTSSIAQVSVFRTSQSNSDDYEKNISGRSSLHINKIRNSSSTNGSNYNRHMSRSYLNSEPKRVLSINKSRKVSKSDKNKTNLLHKLEVYLAKFGKFTRRQIIKFKLMLKNILSKASPLDQDSTIDSLKQLSRTASTLLQDSKRRSTSNKIISRRITSSLNSGLDPNNTFYNNIMKEENLSRSNSVRRNLSIKLNDLINERRKSLNLTFQQSNNEDENSPSKSLSLRRSPSSMKRAVSTITTNNSKKKTIREEEEDGDGDETSSKSSQRTTQVMAVERQYGQMGSVRLTRLNLEPLEEDEGTEDLTIKSNTIVNQSVGSEKKDSSEETSVYEDAIDYTEQEMSLISFYNNTTGNNANSTITVSNTITYKSINHKPSNIRVISGGLNEIDADETVDSEGISSFGNKSDSGFSYERTRLGNETTQDKLIVLEYDESEEEEQQQIENPKKESEELTQLLNDFLVDILIKKININIQVAKLKVLADLESPKRETEHQVSLPKNSNSFYRSTRTVTRSFSLPIGLR
ncbi:hypothetical protein ACO0SA_000004 [Hanseniaspora valbyensis]